MPLLQTHHEPTLSVAARARRKTGSLPVCQTFGVELRPDLPSQRFGACRGKFGLRSDLASPISHHRAPQCWRTEASEQIETP